MIYKWIDHQQFKASQVWLSNQKGATTLLLLKCSKNASVDQSQYLLTDNYDTHQSTMLKQVYFLSVN